MVGGLESGQSRHSLATVLSSGHERHGKQESGSACWARTSDPMINSHLLYQLS